MTKQRHGKECKICGRPFTIFQWCPGAGMRNKKTECCQTCAKVKNVCQTCVLDLEFGLPTQVRDTVLQSRDDVPRSDINREFFIASVEGSLGNDSLINYAKSDAVAREQLKRMARPAPYYNRNRQHLCSFFAKGECTRGDECPYRHELPVDNGLSHQNIKDRYYGKNDPVAQRMLNRTDKSSMLATPEDTSITSVFLTGIEAGVTDTDLRSHFHTFGEIKSLVLVAQSKVAFVNYTTRAAAELAIRKSYNNCNIKGHAIRVQWGRAKPQAPKSGTQILPGAQDPAPQQAPSLDDILSMPAGPPPPGQGHAQAYPSQDPTTLGTATRDFRA
ncbi:RNA binding motif protein 22 [Thoreauomyces humboldtii]|nr:RNA binding motif protein 22 [Thoreauomyces humboldtii]